ncbi:MAG: hypothetical protein HY001_00175 [Candidatus Portnoybacteria bacterium]|nr:hypothetical protein [Candidatus Portnoybacteria bacterium]
MVPDHKGTGDWECPDACKNPPVSIRDGVLYGAGGEVLLVHGEKPASVEKKAA